MGKAIRAWHFVGDTLRDGTPIPNDGVPLIYHGKLKLCVSGLRASIYPFDALQYAPGNTLCFVECEGNILHGDDKLVCSQRTIIARMDVTDMLRYFARMQALSMIHLYPMRDTGADDVVLDYLMTGDDSLRAAAGDAAGAAWDAALAAGDAARDAARAARAAAWDAGDAAGAAWYVARAAAGAARAAAWDAGDAAGDAWYAARAAAGADFNALVRECFWDFL
jgi:hypothetical protein